MDGWVPLHAGHICWCSPVCSLLLVSSGWVTDSSDCSQLSVNLQFYFTKYVFEKLNIRLKLAELVNLHIILWLSKIEQKVNFNYIAYQYICISYNSLIHVRIPLKLQLSKRHQISCKVQLKHYKMACLYSVCTHAEIQLLSYSAVYILQF